MAAKGDGGDKSDDFYAVLGLNKECTAAELRNAYKKLALIWHPDRCSASGNLKFVEEAKKKFQAIQQAYSVLSDANKRFLYDVGVYDSDDGDDENGMGDFLSEMAVMMSQTKANENVEESFNELQELFEEMFQGDTEALGSSSQGTTSSSCSTSSSTYVSYIESSSSNKRNSCEMNTRGKTNMEGPSSFDVQFQSFCLGVEQQQEFRKGKGARGLPGGTGGSRRRGRKQKLSSGHDVSSNDHLGISASWRTI